MEQQTDFHFDWDLHFMRMAYAQAKEAESIDEVPIGAVIVIDNKVIGKAHNQIELLKDVTAHAEILAITQAAQYLGTKYLKDCTLYITLEPCQMCAGAIHWAQIPRIVFGASDPKKGFTRVNPPILIPSKTEVIGGVLADECGQIIKDFFKRKREG